MILAALVAISDRCIKLVFLQLSKQVAALTIAVSSCATVGSRNDRPASQVSGFTLQLAMASSFGGRRGER